MTEQTAEPAADDFRVWFEDRLEALLIPAREMVKSDIEHQPMLMAYSTDDQVAILPLKFESGADKDFAAHMHRTLALQERIYAVIMVTEAWAALDNNSDLMPSERPDRREILLFNAIRRNQQLMAKYDIDRTTKTIGEPLIIDTFGGPTGGRMTLNQPLKH
jgi:hypothetical protein